MLEGADRTSEVLLERIKDAEDHIAWSEFFQFYWELIIGWAKMNGCSDSMAQDVFQETVVNLLKNLPTFEYDQRKGSFRAYLKTIVIRRVRDAFRREGKYVTESQINRDNNKHSSIELLADQRENDAEMDKHWVKTTLSQALRQAYDKVDDMTYKSFCLHVLNEMPVDQVAKKLQIPQEKNIYEHKRRMMDIIKREFTTLIDDMGNSGLKINNTLLKEALEELIRGANEERATLAMESYFVREFERFSDLKDKLTNLELTETGTFLVYELEKPQSFKLENAMTVGRNEDCDICIDGETISGLHARFAKSERGWSIRDENSRNGVFINGKKIKVKEFLKSGDIIHIASSNQLIFIENHVE